jgi:uncharacterized membrane protein
MRDLKDRPTVNSGETERKTKVLGQPEALAGWCCYAPFVGLICSILWICTEPSDSKFVRFHALQSLGLAVVSIVVWTGLNILASIGLGVITSLISSVFSLVMFGAWVYCMFQAGKHRVFKLPVIGDFAEKNA